VTRDDAFSAILARQTALNAQDLEDLTDPALSEAELRELVTSYRDLKAAGPDVWATVLEILAVCEAVANVIIPITGAVTGVFGVVTAAKAL
jgi:hypothetical protein